jgi:hypothetical protein
MEIRSACNNCGWVKSDLGENVEVFGSYSIMGLLKNGNVQCDVSSQVAKFYGAVHSVLKRCADELIVVHLIKHVCLPILYYGVDCIALDEFNRSLISKALNTAIRLAFKIHKRESTRMLLFCNNILSAAFRIDCLQLLFIRNLGNSFYNMFNVCYKYKVKCCHYTTLFSKYDIVWGTSCACVNFAVWSKFKYYCGVLDM